MSGFRPLSRMLSRVKIPDNCRISGVSRDSRELLHPVRENLAALERIKAKIGSYAFAAQYQQYPAPLGGSLVK